MKNRGVALGLHGIGRLKDGVTLEQARADMDAVSLHLAKAFPDTNRGTKANLIPLKPSMTGRIKPVLLLLLACLYALLFGLMGFLRREGLSAHFALEVVLVDEGDVFHLHRVGQERAGDRVEHTDDDEEQRDLIIQYYAGEGRAKLENRKAMAGALGITSNALSIRACRIRDKLEACVRRCLEGE